MRKFLSRLLRKRTGPPRTCRYCHAMVTQDHYCGMVYREVEYSNDSDFMLSAAVAYMTDSPLMGAAVGGDAIGAMIGAGLRPDDADAPQSQPEPQETPGPVYNTDPEQVSSSPIELESPDPTPSSDPSPDYSSSSDSSSSFDSGSSDSSSYDSGGSSDCGSSDSSSSSDSSC